MKKLLFTLLTGVAIFAMSTSDVKAQDYKNAIGGRFGSYNGITFKTGLNNKAMLELIGNFRSSKKRFSILSFLLLLFLLLSTPLGDIHHWFHLFS